MNIKKLGQVFTPYFVVDKMLSLRKNFGRCMEPSCGDGAIASRIPNIFAIEFDYIKNSITKVDCLDINL